MESRLRRWLFRCVLLIWGCVPPLALLPVARLIPENVVRLWIWQTLAVSWAVSFVVMSWLLLRLADKDKSSRALELLSLLCTISLGLPAVALGALPVSGLAPNWLKQPHSEETILLKDLLPAADAEALSVVYIVGWDASKSFSPDKDEKVKAVLLQLFGDHGIVGAAMKDWDHFEIYAFSQGKPQLLKKGDALDTLEHPGRQSLLSELKTGSLLQRLRAIETNALSRKRVPLDGNDLDINNTDVLGFLNEATAMGVGKQVRAVRLILFSDFQQSPGVERQELNRLLRKLFSTGAKIQNLSVVAFHAPPAAAESKATDLLPELHAAMPETIPWQEVDLDGYLATTYEADLVARPSGLIAGFGTPRRCELVPPTFDSSNPKKISLVVPESPDFDEIYFGLDADDGEATPLRVQIPGCEGAFDGTLEPEPGRARYCKLRSSPRSGNLVIDVDHGRSRPAGISRGSLKVVVPARNQSGTIKLSVPPFGSLAVFHFLVLVLLILTALPLVLVFSIWPRTMPAAGSAPARARASAPAPGGAGMPA